MNKTIILALVSSVLAYSPLASATEVGLDCSSGLVRVQDGPNSGYSVYSTDAAGGVNVDYYMNDVYMASYSNGGLVPSRELEGLLATYPEALRVVVNATWDLDPADVDACLPGAPVVFLDEITGVGDDGGVEKEHTCNLDGAQAGDCFGGWPFGGCLFCYGYLTYMCGIGADIEKGNGTTQLKCDDGT